MKKSLVSAALAFAMVVVGVAPAAQAVGSNAGAFAGSYFSESGPVLSPSAVVPAGARSVNISARMVPNSSAWAAIQNGTRVLVAGSGATLDGVAIVNGANGRASYSSQINDSTGANVSSNYGSNSSQSFVVPASASVNNAAIYVYMSVYTGGMYGVGNITAGTYAFTPSLTIDGTAVNMSDYTVTYSYSIQHNAAFTAAATSTYVNKSGSLCVNTTGYSAGDALTVTAYNNGTAGINQMNHTMTSRLGKAVTPASMSGSPLNQLSNMATGVYSYTLTSNEINTLLLVDVNITGQRNSAGAESLDVSVTRNGTEVTVPCYSAAAAAPTVTNSGTTTTMTTTDVSISGLSSFYDVRCYGDPTVMGPNSMPLMPTTAVNGVCTFNNTSAATTYNFYYRVSLQGAGVYANAIMSASVSSVGAVAAQGQQVAPQAPAIVFNQPKFEIPAKIAISASGKVSLTGKDMGVTSVLVGGKDQKIDVNSTTKLDFDTTGLTAGVHDLVMKGAFGTYTVQKAIQVGTPVATKVHGLSARTVSMAGGELSINGVGLEGATQITMNGQILEIVSKTDTKVTFKVPASTLATKNNSILIAGSFLPVLFKNAVTYTN
jgi:hypothetical protein